MLLLEADNLMRAILNVTGIIQSKFPELYEHLNETPLFLSYRNMDIQELDFEHYLESLNTQLCEFEHCLQLHNCH